MMKLGLSELAPVTTATVHRALSSVGHVFVFRESVRGRGWGPAKAEEDDSVCYQGAGGATSEPFA